MKRIVKGFSNKIKKFIIGIVVESSSNGKD